MKQTVLVLILILALAVVGPLSAIPQIYEIFATHEVAGISLLTWSFWEAISIPWFIYGIVHKDLAITVSSTFWFITQGAVIAGVLIYS